MKSVVNPAGGAANAGVIVAIAKEEGLTGYVMFEVLGRHRPERARVAPPSVHDATVAYVLRHVLGAPALTGNRFVAVYEAAPSSHR